MIIFNITGGLGNQFFQYAFGRYLSLKNDEDLNVRVESYKNDLLRKPKLEYFNTSFKISSKEDQVLIYSRTYNRIHPFLKKVYRRSAIVSFRNYFTDKIEPIFHKKFKKATKGYFDGYWAYEDYFKEIRSTLIHEFSLRDEWKTHTYKLLESELLNSNSVAVHVRRGDYISNAKSASILNSLPPEYYYQAIERLKSKYTDLKFYVFSDDIPWVKKNFNKEGVNFYFIDSTEINQDYMEFSLMKCCKHFIIANSTFSWWAAWLSENEKKNVIAPSKWYRDKKMQSLYNQGNMIPANWVKL